jgi:hypothetical protein
MLSKYKQNNSFSIDFEFIYVDGCSIAIQYLMLSSLDKEVKNCCYINSSFFFPHSFSIWNFPSLSYTVNNKQFLFIEKRCKGERKLSGYF